MIVYGMHPRLPSAFLLLVIIWLQVIALKFQEVAGYTAIPSVVEPACDQFRQPDGCLKLSDWVNCDSKAASMKFMAGAGVGMKELMNEAIDQSPSFLFATMNLITAAARKYKEMYNETLYPTDLHQPFPYYTVAWAYGSFDGTYTIEELLQKGEVNTVLGAMLGLSIPIQIQRNGSKVQVKGEYDRWWSSIMGYIDLCGGGQVFMMDKFCCRPPGQHELEELGVDLDMLPNITSLTELDYVRATSKGGCGVAFEDMLSSLPELTSNPELHDVIDATLSGCNASVNDIAVTMFLATQNSLKCGYLAPTLASNCQQPPPRWPTTTTLGSTTSWDDCCMACYDDPHCGLWTWPEGGSCTLHVSNELRGMPLTCIADDFTVNYGNAAAVGVPGLLPLGFGSDYVLYHMVPGAYCPEQLVQAGSINTLYGHMVDQRLPLTFRRANNGSVVLSVLSGQGANGNVTREVVVEEVFSSCRSVIYVINDEYYPPRDSNQTLPFSGATLCDTLVENTNLLNKTLIWQDGCFNPVPSVEKIGAGNVSVLPVVVSSDVAPVATESSQAIIDPLAPATDSVLGETDPPSPPAQGPGPPPPPPSSSDSSSSSKLGILTVVITVPVVCVVAAVAGSVGVWYCRRRRRTREEDDGANATEGVVRKTCESSDDGGKCVDACIECVDTLHTPPSSHFNRSSTSTSPLNSIDGGALGHKPSLEHKSMALAQTLATMKSESSVLDASWELTVEDISFNTDGEGNRHRLGKGGYGEVFLGSYGHTAVAVKCVPHGEAGAANIKQLAKEISMLKECRNANVVQFYGGCLQDGNVMLVTEYMPLGDVYTLLQGDNGPLWTWNGRGKFVLLDIARGLAYLHSRRIVHCDLKSPNILLGRNGMAKIADFGMARMMLKEYVTRTNAGGTLAWAAPELLMCSKITEKVDIFSFGVMIWEIVTGEQPARGMLRDLRPGEDCPEVLVRLFESCLSREPEDRPSADELCSRIKEMVLEDANVRRTASGSGDNTQRQQQQ